MSWRITVDEAGKGRLCDIEILEWSLSDALETLTTRAPELGDPEDSDGRSFQITASPVA